MLHLTSILPYACVGIHPTSHKAFFFGGSRRRVLPRHVWRAQKFLGLRRHSPKKWHLSTQAINLASPRKVRVWEMPPGSSRMPRFQNPYQTASIDCYRNQDTPDPFNKHGLGFRRHSPKKWLLSPQAINLASPRKFRAWRTASRS